MGARFLYDQDKAGFIRWLAVNVLKRSLRDVVKTSDFRTVKKLVGAETVELSMRVGEDARRWFWNGGEEDDGFSFDLCCAVIGVRKKKVLDYLEPFRVPKNSAATEYLDHAKAEAAVLEMIASAPNGVSHETLRKVHAPQKRMHTTTLRHTLVRLRENGSVYIRKKRSAIRSRDGVKLIRLYHKAS